MRKSVLAAAMLAALSVPAFAADLAVKAAPGAFSTNSSYGWYAGLGTDAAVAAGNVSGTAFPSNVTADGGVVSGDVGYIKSNCVLGTWCQLEADVKYQNIAGANAGGSVSSQWAVSGEFDVGVQPLQTLLSVVNLNNPFPTFNPTSLLPAAIAVATTPREYWGFIGEAYQINGSIGSASGQTWGFAPGVTTGYRFQTLNSAGTPNGGSLKIHADILFPTRGLDVSGLFAAPGGAPPRLVTSSIAESTIYRVGLSYDFGLNR